MRQRAVLGNFVGRNSQSLEMSTAAFPRLQALRQGDLRLGGWLPTKEQDSMLAGETSKALHC